jgi:hypothetical protein
MQAQAFPAPLPNDCLTETIQALILENYFFLVRLRSTSNPTITRILSVPAGHTFARFHEVLQIAFGWANCHMYQFKVFKVPEDGEVSFLSLPRPLSCSPSQAYRHQC